MPRRKNSGVHIRHGGDGTSSGSRHFDAVFDGICKCDEIREKARGERDLEKRAKIAKELADARKDMKRQMAWHREIIAFANEYIAEHGHDDLNMTELIRWLRAQGINIRADGTPGDGLTQRGVREILRAAFGFAGQRGRKPKTRKYI